jgi:hypothetical protein
MPMIAHRTACDRPSYRVPCCGVPVWELHLPEIPILGDCANAPDACGECPVRDCGQALDPRVHTVIRETADA